MMSNQDESFMRKALEQMLTEFRDGRPDIVLFTTFNFNSSFFESNILPLLVGNSIEELKGNSETREAINSILEQVKTVVVCDRSAHPEPKGDLRYGLMPVGLEKGRFHPKIILMSGVLKATGKTGHWLSVGSGNLSLSGWAVNREVVGVTPIAKKHLPELQALVKWLVEEAEQRISWLSNMEVMEEGRIPFSIIEEGNIRNVLHSLLESLDQNYLPDDEADELPSLHLALPASLRDQTSIPEVSLLTALKGRQTWQLATIVSPYWADVPKLMEALQVKQCNFVPSMRPDGKYSFPQETLTERSDLAGKYSFLKFQKDAARYTHAKSLLLENDEEQVICIGSANFTTAAMLHGAGQLSNVEAMLRYKVNKSTQWNKMFVALDSAQIVTLDDEPTDEGSPQLPPFDAEVLCDWKQKKLFCRLRIHQGERLCKITVDIAGYSKQLDTSEGVIQLREVIFKGKLPVRNFTVVYSKGNGANIYYQGLVTQLNAADDELGYLPRPRLNKVLELLRSLDPTQSEENVKRQVGQRGVSDGDEDDVFEPSCDFFSFYQATYKMRNYYSKHPELDPFSESAPQGIPILYRAVTLQPTETSEAQIERYIQLTELLETLELLKSQRALETSLQVDSVASRLHESITQEITELETILNTLLKDSKLFRDMFGISGDGAKIKSFLTWFRHELRGQNYV
jgi:hypothetical protein